MEPFPILIWYFFSGSVLKRWCVLQSVDSIPLIYLSDAIFEQVYIAGDSPKSEIYRDNNLRYILLLLLMMVPTWQSIQDDSSRVWVNRIYGFGEENPHAAAAVVFLETQRFSRPLLMLQNSIRLEHICWAWSLDFLEFWYFLALKKNPILETDLENCYIWYLSKKREHKLFYDYCQKH